MKSRLSSLLPILLTAAVWSAPSSSSAQDTTPTFHGTVRHLDGRPVGNVTVILGGSRYGIPGITNSDGTFAVEYPPTRPGGPRYEPGDTGSIRVELDGYSVLAPWDGRIGGTFDIPEDGLIGDVILGQNPLF